MLVVRAAARRSLSRRAPSAYAEKGRRLRAGLRARFVLVAPEPAERLPERGSSFVVRRPVGFFEVRSCSLNELSLVQALPDPLAPEPKLPAEAPQVVARLLDDAEVDQGEAFGRAQLEFVDRALPGVEVDLGRWRDGPDVPVGH